MKIVLGILMVVIGILGLASTACGVAVLPSSAIGLIGIIPGALMLWAASRLWKEIGSRDSASPKPPSDDDSSAAD